MKNFQTILSICLVIILFALSGCQASTSSISGSESSGVVITDASQQKESENDIFESGYINNNDLLSQVDALYQQLDSSRLPLQEGNYYWRDTNPETIAELPKQLVVDTPEAYIYAQIIGNYLYFGGNKLEDFDDVESMYMPGVIQTAIYHTTPIQWRWEIYSGAKNGYDGPFDNHVLSALMKNEAEEGRGLCDLYYADDIQTTIGKMFGVKVDINNMSIEPYIYYARENVYGRIGDFGGPAWVYPMLTAMEPTTDGMICEVVLVSALDKDTPTTSLHGSDELTSANFETTTANSSKYRYTFVDTPDGNSILTSLHTLRQKTLDS